MKIKCSAKYIVKRMKRYALAWEEIFANHRSNKGLVFTPHKELLSSTGRNQQFDLKMGKILEMTLHQRNYTDGKEVHEKVFNIIATRKMEIKPSVRYHSEFFYQKC